MSRTPTLCSCGAPRKPDAIFCKKCWSLVPLPLRRQVWDSYWLGKGSPEHLGAIKRCHIFVNQARAALAGAEPATIDPPTP